MIYPLAGLLLAPPEDGGGGFMVLILNVVLIFLIFYWLLIRPQKKERDRHQAMIDALKKGDEVVMAGGIVGTILHVDQHRLTLKTGENTRVVVERSKVGNRIDDTDGGKD
ncbi:MAG: preprotein translocase subunit YajC [Gemmatimonadota bacterium]